MPRWTKERPLNRRALLWTTRPPWWSSPKPLPSLHRKWWVSPLWGRTWVSASETRTCYVLCVMSYVLSATDDKVGHLPWGARRPCLSGDCGLRAAGPPRTPRCSHCRARGGEKLDIGSVLYITYALFHSMKNALFTLHCNFFIKRLIEISRNIPR